jgi:hypothetical protein
VAETEQRAAFENLVSVMMPYAQSVHTFHVENAGHPYDIGMLGSMVEIFTDKQTSMILMPQCPEETLVEWLNGLESPPLAMLFFQDTEVQGRNVE